MDPIRFSDAAVTHLKTMLAQRENGVGFRLSIKKTGCSGYAYLPEIIDTVKSGDVHFMVQDDLPVYVDPTCLEYIKDVLVDFVAQDAMGLKQKRLVFVNPNEKGRCGCGESFTIE